MSSSHVVLADQKQHRNSSSSSTSNTSGSNNNNTNKPTNDLAQIEKIKRIVQREILDNGRHLFPDGRWPSDGVAEPEKHPEPYSAAMKFGGRDPSSKKRPGLTKRPPNMWMIFRMHAASVVMEDFPEVNQAALTSVLAPIWQTVITPQEKNLVREESERLKEFHKLQFPEWKYKPRQKKRTSQQQLQQAQQQHGDELDDEEAEDEAPLAKRECHHGNRYNTGRHQQQQQQQHLHHQGVSQHFHQQQQQQQLCLSMPASVSPYLTADSPDMDNIDGLQLPLTVDTSPRAATAAAGAAVSMSANCLPFASSVWTSLPQQEQQQHQQHQHQQHISIPVSLSTALVSGSPPMQQHQASQQHQLAPKDPALRSILASSAPSSVSSTGAGELSCLPDLPLCDYFGDFANLPDLEAYLSPEGCSGGLVAEPAQLPSQQQFDFSDLTDLRRPASMKQEFRYAVI